MPNAKSCSVISRKWIRGESGITPVGRPRPPHDGGPQIEVFREGNVVKQVHVHCSCGEVITLECSYEANAPA
jgi:hypothetical protein